MTGAAPSAIARWTKPSTRPRCSRVISGPDVGVGLAGVSELAARHSLEEALGELVSDGLLHKEARSGKADLACVVVLVGRLLDRSVEIGVGEDEERRLAAELEGDRDDVLGRGLADQASGVDRARERDTADPGMGDERGSRLLSDPLHNVQDPRRQLGLLGEIGEEGAGQRRPLGRLQDGRASGGKGRTDFPGREHEGRIPGRDQRRDAGRVVADAVLDPVCLPGALLQVECQLGEEADVERTALHDPKPGGLEERAVVERLDRGQRLDVGLDQVGEPEEVLGAALGPERGPGGKRLAGGLDGCVHFGAITAGHIRERALVDRRKVGERLRGAKPLAPDEVLG